MVGFEAKHLFDTCCSILNLSPMRTIAVPVASNGRMEHSLSAEEVNAFFGVGLYMFDMTQALG
jgi:hypothetical protein